MYDLISPQLGIQRSFWLQAIALGIAFYLLGGVAEETRDLAFLGAVSWPVIRIPVFVMGMIAGLHRASSAWSLELKGLHGIVKRNAVNPYEPVDPATW